MKKYWKRHYCSDIKKDKIEIGFDCDTLFALNDSGNFEPSESIEIIERDTTRPLPEDELTRVSRNVYRIDFWRYEADIFDSEESYEDGCFETDVLSHCDAVVAWDEDEYDYVLSSVNPDFTNIDVDAIADELMAKHKDEIIEDAKELAKEWDIDLTNAEGLNRAFVYALPDWNYVEADEIEEAWEKSRTGSIRLYTFKTRVKNALRDAAIRMIKAEAKKGG